MQVKKFEAKNIKEALQMVKQELGPEAVIISARDNKKSFGLAGEGSVEVTAAISEKSLQKKQYAESRLNKQDRERFKNQTAEVQKKFIDKTVSRYQAKHTPAPEPKAKVTRPSAAATRPVTGRRYIDIFDEEESQMMGKSVADALEVFAQNEKSYQFDDAANGVIPRTATRTVAAAPAPVMANEDVANLKIEVQQLRQLLSQFSQNGGAAKAMTHHPGAEYGLPFELSYQYEKLLNSGIDTRYIVEILEKADKDLTVMDKKKKSLVDAWVARYIMGHTDVVGQMSQEGDQARLHLFMGPSGHGKTTMLVKMASHFVMQEKKRVAVLTADTSKVGAIEQLKIFCQILNVPLETIKHSIEFEKIIVKYHSYDVILVDYPGFSLRDISEIDQLRALMPHRDIPRHTHLVLGAVSKDVDAYEVAQRYNATQFDDLIITKVDESFNHGLLYNVQRKTQKPLYVFGTGTRIPEDLELATKERVLDLIYKITKNNF